MMKHLIFMAIFLLTVTACSSRQLEPTGIGVSPNDLKRSPCACIEIEQDYANWEV